MGRLKSDYQLAADNPVLGKSRVVLWMGGTGIHRFDYDSDRWVEDRSMFGIYIGSPLVEPITEQQAKGTIQRAGGTWVAPSLRKNPELKRLDELASQMQANADGIAMPQGIELIGGAETVVPYWLADQHAPVRGESRTVLWTAGNAVRIWRFDYEADAWVLDPEIPGTFIGTPETTPLTEQDARETIERFGGTWAIPAADTS